ncbi:hypothetical protein ACFLZ1_01140 [Patescibacteria group bacterium]
MTETLWWLDSSLQPEVDIDQEGGGIWAHVPSDPEGFIDFQERLSQILNYPIRGHEMVIEVLSSAGFRVGETHSDHIQLFRA